MPRSSQTTAVTDADMLKEAASHWWLLLLQGILTVLIGFMLMFNPVSTTLLLVRVLGFYWLIAGFIDIVMAVADKSQEHRGLQLFGGVLGVIAGLVVINNAVFAGILTPTIILWFIALVFLVNGVLKIFLGNQTAESSGYDWSWGAFLVGILYVILGIVLLGMPLAAKFATMVFAVSLLALVGGIGMVIMSFRVRSAGKKLS